MSDDPDEDKLSTAASRGARAEALLRNELLAEAFATLEHTYTAAWRATPVRATDDRERLFLAVNLVGKVRDNLYSVLTDGKLAAAELREIAASAERKKNRR